MKKVLKQTLSVLLAVVMIFTITLPAFAEENLAPETQTEQNLSYNSSNALGETLVNAIEDEDASRDEYDGKGIFNVALSGLEAKVALSAPDDCTVVVSVYEEETMQMVTSGKADVSSDDMGVVVTLADFELPDFFVIKAFILNSENAPVCTSYVNLDNTKAYVEAMSKTTEDFDSELVINLDNSETDNFAVVTEDAQTAQTEDNKNVLVSADDDTGVYVIENADSSVSSLKPGEILYFTYGEGANDYILTKVGTIKTKNGITTITASDDYEMSDFFDYIDIDTSKNNEPQTYSLRRSFDDETGQLDEEKSFPISSGSAELKFSGSNWDLAFNVDGAVTFYVKLFYDVNLFSKDYYEFSYWVQVGAEAKVTFDFKAAFEKKVTLIDTDIPVVPGLDIHFSLKFTVKAQASLNVSGTVSFTMKNGASRNSDGEQKKIEQKPTLTFKADVSGSFSIDLIPEIETGFRIVKVFFVDMNVPVDFKITGTLYVPTSAEDKAKHSCAVCVDGEITLTVNLDIAVKFGLKRSNAETIVSFAPLNKSSALGSFYMSGSGSGIKFGWGECPNNTSDTGGTSSGNEIANGTCGTNLTWTLYDDGELVIDGTGAMSNYGHGSGPWFSYRSSIKSVTIPDSVTSIGDFAFNFCGNLKNIIIPDSVTKIGNCAFYGCHNLKSINIGSGLNSKLDLWWIYGCYALEKIIVDENNQYYSSDDGVLFNKDKTIFIRYPAGKENDLYTMPNSVTEIEEYAFYQCDNAVNLILSNNITAIDSYAFSDFPGLINILIPDSVTTIGDYAFRYCYSLASITIPDSVTTIGEYAFETCYSLTSVTIPDSVTTIGEYAFETCYSLTSVTIPGSVKSISSGAFYECTSLENVEIGNGVTTIGSAAFSHCDSLASITMPNSVTEIEEYAFYDCDSLTSIAVDENNANYSNDEYGALFNKNKTALIQYPHGNSRTEYTIPDSVTTIGSSAFSHCDSLASITIPDSVTTIGSDAFYDCDSLASITIPDSVTTIGSSAFRNCDSLVSITIPDSVKSISFSAFHNSNNLTTVYYTGTEAQWKKISIDSNNTPLTNANIIFNYTPSVSVLMYLLPDNKLSAYSVSNMQVKTISDAVIGNEYVMLAVKDENAEDLLAPSNLLYIDQKTAESEELTFEYVIDESVTDYDVLVFGQKLPHYHLYNGVVTTEPTCTDVGIKTFTCSCGDSYTEEIEKLNHEYETVVTAPTCTEQGYTTYTCECGDTYVADYVNETGHSHSSEITTSATHLKEGVMTFACECGDTYTEPVAKLPDHTYETVVTAPTCTEQGFTTYTCECGDSYADDYVEAKGHTDELIPGYAATCTETGLTDGVKCSVCGTVTAEQKTIPVVAHNDSNNDGICDNCDFDATKNCSHTCHSDNAFIQFFWKIINFLQKLFGVKSARYCDCGVDHW